jgi:hypothetical protein
MRPEIMNTHVSEYARQQMAYKAVRDRLMRAGPKAKPKAIESEQVSQRFMAPQIPLWERQEIQFDAHIVNYRAWQISSAERLTAKGHIINRCNEFGVSYMSMIGAGRSRPIYSLRQILYFEVHEKLGRSFTEIGRAFGGRDHTTVLHGYRKIKAMSASQREKYIRQAIRGLRK